MDWDEFGSLVFKLVRDGEHKYCLLLAIGVFTGLRISDLLQLRFTQLELGDILSIHVTIKSGNFISLLP